MLFASISSNSASYFSIYFIAFSTAHAIKNYDIFHFIHAIGSNIKTTAQEPFCIELMQSQKYNFKFNRIMTLYFELVIYKQMFDKIVANTAQTKSNHVYRIKIYFRDWLENSQ